jgi:hypothetical protein
LDFHQHAGTRFQRRAHVGVDIRLQQGEIEALHQPRDDNPRFGLAESGSDAGARAAAEGDKSKSRRLESGRKTLRLEFMRIGPMGRVAVGQVN